MTNTRTGFFRKRDNLAAWVIQFLCATILFILAILAIVRPSTSANGYGRISIDGIVYAVISLITIALNIAEVVTFAKTRLNPVFLLVSAVFKTGIWFSFLILLIRSFAARGSVYAPLDFVLELFLFGSSLSQLVIGSIVVHRRRKGTLVAIGVPAHKESVGSF